MKITQEPKFQPITITLETAEEAEALWAELEGRSTGAVQKARLNDLSNWFRQQARLLGI